MKTHSMAGAEMIKDLSRNFNEPLLDTIYDICRWHHERFDGRGYPDGLVGDNIPISAQVVSIADAYDALTSERCYKKAFSHKEAIRMIKDGECGMFNPVLVKCLISIGDNLVRELSAKAYTPYGYNGADIINVTQKLSHYGLAYSESNLNQQKYEYNRVRYISDNSSDIFIDYNSELSLLSVNKHGVEEIHIPGTVHDPLNSKDLKSMIDMMSVEKIRSMLDKNDPNNVDFDTDICFNTGERPLHYKCFCHAVWIWSDSPKYLGLICKLMPEQNDS